MNTHHQQRLFVTVRVDNDLQQYNLTFKIFVLAVGERERECVCVCEWGIPDNVCQHFKALLIVRFEDELQ